VKDLFDELAPIFTVGQVASMLGVQAAFVRRLDAEEVIQPARSDGGHRRYSQADVRQVLRVAEMADDGLSLAGIRRILVLEAEVADLRRQLDELRPPTPSPSRRRPST
jgi:DNA-binding transcriptional MerR regulator